ncbi:MAG: efflux RND transporter periplasmic adaptor subunit, partial [Verrucomicrobiota bacterium]
WVPMSALTENIRGLWSLYSINENSITERKVVDLIHIEDRRAFVRGNFANGETIVADGVHRLVPGLAIVPQNPISISQD